MPDNNPLSERGRSLEEEYFRKKDRELVEKIRRAAEVDRARQELSARSGLSDPELIAELEALGFTPETVVLLPFLPLIQVAWAEGGITSTERERLVALARSRGIDAGTAADGQLAAWLAQRPAEDVFTRGMRLVRAMLESGKDSAAMTADELVKYCEEIAAASGGVLGMRRISADERAMLAAIATGLKSRA